MRITLPQLGETVAEGTIGRWLKQVGDRIEKDDLLVEIITDKVNAELPSPAAGILTEILAPEGATLPVGSDIAVIEEIGAETGGGSAQRAPVVQAEPAVQVDPASQPEPATAPAAGLPGGPQPAPVTVGLTSSAAPSANGAPDTGADRPRTSPFVRRIAREHGVNVAEVPGTGHAGRVTKDDILRFLEARDTIATAPPSPMAPTPEPPPPLPPSAPVPAPAAPDAPVVSPGGPATPPAAPPMPPVGPPAPVVPIYPGDEVMPAGPMRRAIAEHMVRSIHTSPHAWTQIEVDMTGLVRLRTAVRDRFREKAGVDLTYLPFMVAAVVDALREYRAVNAAWSDGRIVLRRRINVGIAVAVDDGLIVPVIHDADEKNLVGLARAVADLTERARAGQLKPADVQGGTFTVNNPGAFGAVSSVSIINQPQAAILAMNAVVKRPVVVEDMIAIRSIMNLSLSFDHRILDGAIVLRFLDFVKRRLEAYTPDTAVL